MANQFLNGGPDCCCCNDLFTRDPGVAMPFTLTGVSLSYVSRSGNNHYNPKLFHSSLTISALDQINKLYISNKAITGFTSRLIRCDIEAGVNGYNPANPTLSLNPHVAIYARPNSSTTYLINSIALDKRNQVVYFVERATTAGVRVHTLYAMSYLGGAVSTIHTFPSPTQATGYSIWHPGLQCLFIVTQTTTLNELKMVTLLGTETVIATSPHSGTGPGAGYIHCIELDLTRGELWWVEREVGANRKDIVSKSNISGGNIQVMYTTPETHVINCIKKSYQHDCMVFNYFRRDIPKEQDVGSGLFTCDFQMTQPFTLFYDRSIEFNEHFGAVLLGNVMEPSFELYCGHDRIEAGFLGA